MSDPIVQRTTPRRAGPLRVLVVDDSPVNREVLKDILCSDPQVEVVARAADGEEALRTAMELKPGCICLDLQMPNMDGFTFLRLLMAKQPTPVIVISSLSRKPEVFKALELGAIDFVAKPDLHDPATDVRALREDLLGKIATVRALRVEPSDGPAAGATTPPPSATTGAPASPAAPPVTSAPTGAAEAARTAARPGTPPSRLVVIGASTGGPGALGSLLAALPRDLPVAYAVAQHMPRPFTGSFAQRLGKNTGFDVREAEDGDELVAGRVLVAPGGRHLRVVRAGGRAGPLRAALQEPDPRDGRRYCPSVDVLFESAAEAMQERVCAVVLTGMGNDGSQGVARVKEMGGLALAESAESAVVFGMPREAVDSGNVDEVLSLPDIVARLRRFAEGQ